MSTIYSKSFHDPGIYDYYALYSAFITIPIQENMGVAGRWMMLEYLSWTRNAWRGV
jgi:hypothetical protein